jgi:hypothetical protein
MADAFGIVRRVDDQLIPLQSLYGPDDTTPNSLQSFLTANVPVAECCVQCPVVLVDCACSALVVNVFTS